MGKTKIQSSQQRVEVVYGEQLPLWYARLTALAFFMGVALVMARATTLETLREVYPVGLGVTLPPRTLGPAGSLVLDMLCCVPAMLVLLRRVLDKAYVLRSTISHALLGALALWAVISTAWSADKFAAGITAAHFFSAGVLVWAMTQLVRSWLRLRWVAAAGVGLLMILVVHGLYYQYEEHPRIVEHWQKNRAAELAARGWAEDSFTARQFEGKLLSGEMVGFSASPNTYATMLVVLSIVAVGVIVQRIRDSDQIGWPIILALAILAAPLVGYHTGSRTAAATSVLAAIMLLAIAFTRDWLAAHRRLAFIAGIALVLVGTIAVIGHGLYHNALPGDSLTFRWNYWVGSARIAAEHPILGVGWSNFGLHYLAVRLPIASEEIKDPHNIFVRVMVELGIVGLILLIAWLTRLAWELTRPNFPPAPPQPSRARPGALWPIITVSFAAVSFNTLASLDFSADGSYVFLELFRRAVYFGLLVLAFAAVMMRSTREQELDDRPAPWLAYAILVALAIFLLHNVVDFSFAESGPLFVFALLAGAMLGVRMPSVAGRKTWRRTAIGTFAGTLVLWIVLWFILVIPLIETEARAREADEAIRDGRPARAAAMLRSAFDTSPLPNADYAYRAAMAAMMGGLAPAEVEVMLSEAIATNPREFSYRVTRARYELMRPPAERNEPQIISDLERAIALNSNDVPTRQFFGETLELLGRPVEARKQYEAALYYNDRLHPDNTRRLPPAEVERLEGKIGAL